MRPAYLDATVFIHAVGRDLTLRTSCTAVLTMVRAAELAAHSSVLTVEEVVHVRNRRLGDRARAVRDGLSVAAMIALHEVTRPDLDRALRAFADHPSLDARDAVHVAVAERLGLEAIVTTDSDLDGLPRLRRVDPRDHDEVAQLANG